MEFLLLIGIGLFVGTYGSIVGIGGGLLLIPILTWLYPELSPLTITGISITVACVTTLVSFTSYAKQNRIDYKNGAFLLIGAVPMTAVGVICLSKVSVTFFSIAFAVLVLLIAGFIIYKSISPAIEYVPKNNEKTYELSDKDGNHYVYPFNRALATSMSTIGGLLPGFFGISGGIIRVPFLTYVMHMPLKVATATSSFVLFFTSLTSVIAHLVMNSYNPDWITIVCLIVGIIPGAKLGASLSRKIPANAISIVLAIGLLLAGIRMILNA